jgi:hypothetical protein
MGSTWETMAWSRNGPAAYQKPLLVNLPLSAVLGCQQGKQTMISARWWIFFPQSLNCAKSKNRSPITVYPCSRPSFANQSILSRYAYTEGGFLKSEEPLLEQAPYPYDTKSLLQHQDTEIVGKAVAMISVDWTYVYRLYEPAELYNRKTDLAELHNLAAVRMYGRIVQEMQAEMFQWMVQTSDFLPFQKDARFPPVELESPEEQYNRRIQAA